MRFPYTQIGSSIPARPYLRISLRHGFFTTDPMYALVDSGSDYSLFPYEIASRVLKIDLQNPPAEQWVFYGTSGLKQFGYLAEVEIAIFGSKGETAHCSTKVAFCPDFQFPGGPLLGQKGFFSNFKVTFAQRENCFEIEPYQLEMAL
jgi:hypothetical protein